MKKSNKSKSNSNNAIVNKYAKSVGISTAFGVAVAAVLLLICSFVMSVIDVPQSAIEPMAMFCACLGAFVSGYMCSRINKEKGFFMGLVCGFIIFTLTFLSGIIIVPLEITPMILVKLFSLLVSAGIGGMIGVNKKEKR
ncbi:MAG: TIGR04086 family membrane protein [Oscillospiraceae bacterium]